MLQENNYHSFQLGQLPQGCRHCVRGEKLVLFVTGYCPRRCYFCPLSDDKYKKDVIFANERKAGSIKDIILEARNMRAKGAGITGGDPLARLERTAGYIRALKKEFGKKFHIHLYTSLNLVREHSLQKLFLAGLDEIRFHPDLDSRHLWKNLALAKKFSWDTGMEIPVLPTKIKETKALIDYAQDKVDFINLNELEMADNSQSKLGRMGFATKNKLSYAVRGSLDAGKRLLWYVQRKGYPLPVHLCTATLKDAVQLSNRIRREARYSKKAFDTVDEDGLLVRGALYLPELKPGFGYRKKLEQDLSRQIAALRGICARMKKELNLKHVWVDEAKPRILLPKKHVLKLKKEFLKMGLVPAVVREYPTADQLEIEVEFL